MRGDEGERDERREAEREMRKVEGDAPGHAMA